MEEVTTAEGNPTVSVPLETGSSEIRLIYDGIIHDVGKMYTPFLTAESLWCLRGASP